MKPHTEEIIEGKEATCTEAGLTDGKKCSACGEILAEQEEIAPSHNYIDGICSACGEKEMASEGLEYIISSDRKSYSVKKGSCTDTVIYIPSTYEGLPVTKISDNAFFGYTGLTGIVIPKSVTSIGSFAFQNCTSLENINIPDGVTSIGANAFYGCSSLTSITIPGSVVFTNLDSYTFSECTNLTTVIINDGVKMIVSGMFWGCKNLTSVVIPDSVTSIGSSAFKKCINLTSIIIPDSIERDMGSQVFADCTSLTIYCEAERQPSNWSANWNSSSCTVVWGYKPEN